MGWTERFFFWKKRHENMLEEENLLLIAAASADAEPDAQPEVKLESDEQPAGAAPADASASLLKIKGAELAPREWHPFSSIYYDYEAHWRFAENHSPNRSLLEEQVKKLEERKKEALEACRFAESALHLAVYAGLGFGTTIIGFLLMLHTGSTPIPWGIVYPVWYLSLVAFVWTILWKVRDYFRFKVELQVINLHLWNRGAFLKTDFGDRPISRVGITYGQLAYISVYAIVVIFALLAPIYFDYEIRHHV